MDDLPSTNHCSTPIRWSLRHSWQARHLFEAIVRRKLLTAILTGLVAFGVCAGLTAVRSPVPSIHDEFSYLLAADTFCQGRLNNPPHPFWPHFETFHVIHQPSYASKYPPGQGLVLAVGQWLTGKPIVGIWILSALAAVTCYWMLLGWIPTRWAALGGFLLLVHPGYQIAWGQSYWGGTLAFLGGALVFGAAARMRDCPQVHDAVAMSLGAMILAVSRPYEGFVFCLIIGTVVVAHWWRHGLPAWRVLVLQATLPQVAVVLVGGTCLAYYNNTVTGNWRTMPYQVHESTYGLSPCFLWDQPYQDREYRHAVLADFHQGWGMDSYRKQLTIPGILETKIEILKVAWSHFFPLPMMLPLLFLPFYHARYQWTVLFVASVAWLPLVVTVWNYPHYIAPMAPVLMVLVLMGLRQANAIGKKYMNQFRLATLFVIWQIIFFSASALNYGKAPTDTWQWRRQAILLQLEAAPERHLVFVHYDLDHNPHHEWVYNRADIDQAKVVWAREMNPTDDLALVDYFHDRHIWYLEADAPVPRLIAYPRSSRKIPSAQTKSN